MLKADGAGDDDLAARAEDAAHAERVFNAGLGAVRHGVAEGTQAMLTVTVGILGHVVDWEAENFRKRMIWHGGKFATARKDSDVSADSL